MVFGNRRIPKHLILENRDGSNKRSGVGAGWIILAIAIIVTTMMFGLKAEAHTQDTILEPMSYKAPTSQKATIQRQDNPKSSPVIIRRLCDYDENGKLVRRCIAFYELSHRRF